MRILVVVIRVLASPASEDVFEREASDLSPQAISGLNRRTEVNARIDPRVAVLFLRF
jgi:hypothetical protein